MIFYQVFRRSPFTDELQPIGKLTKHRKSARNTLSKRRANEIPGEQLEIHAFKVSHLTFQERGLPQQLMGISPKHGNAS